MNLDHIKNDTKEERKRRISEIKAQLDSFNQFPDLKTKDKETYEIVLKEAKICGVK